MTDKGETRELLQRRLETQLKEWSTRIDHLKAAAERDMADAELREQLYARLQRLRDQHAAAMEKLDELKHSGARAWRSVRRDIDRMWLDLQDAFDNLLPRRPSHRRTQLPPPPPRVALPGRVQARSLKRR